MRDLKTQATNKLNIVGKVLDMTFREGTTKDGKPYESCNFTVRVNQTYNGREETSEIPVSLFASKYTLSGAPHPGFKTIQDMKSWKSVQEYGEADATIVRMNSANVRENYFISKQGQFIDGWQINTSFVNEGGRAEVATFNIDIFILDMHDELDRDENPTGRLVIKGGIVQYGEKLDIIEFIVEAPDAVEYISRNWEPNQTVNIGGRIRYTTQEEQRSASSSSWGEDLPETSTRVKRELIITRGSDEPFDEEFAYDPVEIKKGFNVRKANIEQAQISAKQGVTKKSAPAAQATPSKYSWE